MPRLQIRRHDLVHPRPGQVIDGHRDPAIHLGGVHRQRHSSNGNSTQQPTHQHFLAGRGVDCSAIARAPSVLSPPGLRDRPPQRTIARHSMNPAASHQQQRDQHQRQIIGIAQQRRMLAGEDLEHHLLRLCQRHRPPPSSTRHAAGDSLATLVHACRTGAAP
jgi:hypothetical protein